MNQMVAQEAAFVQENNEATESLSVLNNQLNELTAAKAELDAQLATAKEENEAAKEELEQKGDKGENVQNDNS